MKKMFAENNKSKSHGVVSKSILKANRHNF